MGAGYSERIRVRRWKRRRTPIGMRKTLTTAAETGGENRRTPECYLKARTRATSSFFWT